MHQQQMPYNPAHLSQHYPSFLGTFSLYSAPGGRYVRRSSVESDAAKLEKEYGLKIHKMKDLQKSEVGRRQQSGLKSLAWEVAGLVMSKPKHVTVSNWEARVLSEAQVEYACIDAYASYRIANILKV